MRPALIAAGTAVSMSRIWHSKICFLFRAG
jgi:hypothetical protein